MEYDSSETMKIIQQYWGAAAPDFSQLIYEDLQPERKKVWLNKILSNAPQKEQMDILDAGTGPGYFAIILSEAGHRVTAIDCTEEMILEAKKNLDKANVSARLLIMDSQHLNFGEESFDLIVSRNVVWTLCDPVGAYREWLRVLRPGGRIIIFDANYGMYCFDKKIEEQKKSDEALYRQLYGSLPKKRVQMNEYFERMYLSDKKRPDWDENILNLLGAKTFIERDVSYELIPPPRRLLNASSPLFMVVAEKIACNDKASRTI
ncbi:MAG: class I SAM-dependent methyltransferase [Clostridiales bacterium]|nr:class I SAM-dependent methyltransferase [Clostridiales bacterium]